MKEAAATPILSCTGCGVRNRVPRHSLREAPRCGRCGVALPQNPLRLVAQHLMPLRYSALGAVCLSLLVLSVPAPGPGTIEGPQNATSEQSSGVPVEQGVLQLFSTMPTLSPLEIVTPPGDDAYLIKLYSHMTGEPLMTIFVRGGENYEAFVPSGLILSLIHI